MGTTVQYSVHINMRHISTYTVLMTSGTEYTTHKNEVKAEVMHGTLLATPYSAQWCKVFQ
jgi:hypothetical protein